MLHSLDRQKIILDNLKNGSVTSINHLIKSTNFNQSTIRRDIKVLENHKKVIVVRGGIIPVKNIEIDPINIENLNEKQKIAQQAASLINDHENIIINENQMASATALGACGIAFFLRAIRAASQGGIEIGFQSEEAFIIASQTARGAARLLLDNHTHPESEIDRVTTPMGATISGLNEMEHQGFSSALIKGITTSTEKVSKLFSLE